MLKSYHLSFVFRYMVQVAPSVLWRCWLGGRKGIRALKKLSGGVLAWLSAWSEVQTCILHSWCHCHALSLASVKSRLVLPFWYRLTRVVPEKGPLNTCVYIVQVYIHALVSGFSERLRLDIVVRGPNWILILQDKSLIWLHYTFLLASANICIFCLLCYYKIMIIHYISLYSVLTTSEVTLRPEPITSRPMMITLVATEYQYCSG